MVDLSQRGVTNKKQRAFHLNDETHARLEKAATLTNSTMSAILDRLIWEDLVLPDDPPRETEIVNVPAVAALPPDPPVEDAPTGREATIADRQINAAGDVDAANAANAAAAARLRKRGHFATAIDGSDQRERDPGLVSRPGNDGFDI